MRLFVHGYIRHRFASNLPRLHVSTLLLGHHQVTQPKTLYGGQYEMLSMATAYKTPSVTQILYETEDKFLTIRCNFHKDTFPPP